MEVTFSAHAKRDLAELARYVELEHGPDRARTVKKQILDAILLLARMPGMGHRREDLPDQSLRVWPVHRWLIVYRPEAVPLGIVRVLGGWQDVQAALEEPDFE